MCRCVDVLVSWCLGGFGSSLTDRSKEIDDIALEVDCSMIIVKEGDVDIGE
jgi:hypothetical protein